MYVGMLCVVYYKSCRIGTLLTIKVVINPLKLLNQSSGGQTNLRHCQKINTLLSTLGGPAQ